MKKNLLVVFILGTLINYANEKKEFILEKKVNIEFTDVKKVFFKPIIRSKKNVVYISKNNSNKEPVKITLYYNNEIIYSKTFKATQKLNKVFRLLENETGSYRAIVQSGGKSFIKDFKI